MRRVVVSEYVSLDGVVEAPGPVGAFEHAGWTRPYWNDEMAQFKFDELFASDALLLGRRTYQEFAAAWPSRTDDTGFRDPEKTPLALVEARTFSSGVAVLIYKPT